MKHTEFWEMKKAHEKEMEEAHRNLFIEIQERFNVNYVFAGEVDFDYADTFIEVDRHKDGEIIHYVYQVNDKSQLKDIVEYILNETKIDAVTVYGKNVHEIVTFRSEEDIKFYIERYTK